MEERELIKKITALMPPSPDRGTAPFGSDSEVLSLKGGKTLFTMDEFSSEDGFLEDDPYLLGWNCAQAGISDIYASGGRVHFAGHSLVVSRKWSTQYTLDFARGVGECLSDNGAQFAGGDLSFAEEWSYTITLIGLPHTKPLSRVGARPGDSLFITGQVGLGNLFYGLNLYKERRGVKKIASRLNRKFPRRSRQSQILSQWASAAIDTSDGLLLALESLVEPNGVGFILEKIPYLRGTALLTRLFKLPKELLFVAGAGEYELLFSCPQENIPSLREAFKRESVALFEIGRVEADRSTALLQSEKRERYLTPLLKGNRDFDSPRDYMNYLIEELEK